MTIYMTLCLWSVLKVLLQIFTRPLAVNLGSDLHHLKKMIKVLLKIICVSLYVQHRWVLLSPLINQQLSKR